VPTISAKEVNKDIVNWLHSRQAWLQEAAVRLLTKGKLGQSDIEELVDLLKTDAGRETTATRSFPGIAPVAASGSANSEELRLVSIGEVHGIENLAPRTPLSFGDGRLVVVYGGNGSGKSGYVRILKKACGKPHATDLRPNVFEPAPRDRGCSITYALGATSNTVSWRVDAGPIEALRSVDIFDSSCGRVYLDSEMEATYTPAAVVLFEDLAEACRRISGILDSEQRALVTQLPPLPRQYADTPTGKIYSSLQASQPQATLQVISTWSEADSKALAQLEERLRTDDPAALARQKRSIKRELDNLYQSVVAACNAVKPAACERIHDLKQVARDRRRDAEAAARATTGSAVLQGIGTDTWRRLWEAARAYSVEVAYPGVDYPNLSEDARCVLCHQPLTAETRARLRDFDEYIRGTFEADACKAEEARDAALRGLPTRPTEEALQTSCQAAGLQDDHWVRDIQAVWDAIEATVAELSDTLTSVQPKGVDCLAFPVLEQMKALSVTLEDQASQLDRDALEFDRSNVQAQKLDLQAREWTSQQASAICAEVERLRKVAMYEEWKRATNTAPISQKAGTIAASLITTAYIERFNSELERLGAKHIRVKLVKTRTERGRPKHRIRLRGLKAQGVNPEDVLSEGEQRIVALAAFLADVTGKAQAAPFVFDDPISSLDQMYEERTALRLIELSRDRQVIVFTHRLSFLGIMCDKAEPEEVHLRLENWGSGQPGQMPLFARRPISALKDLKNDCLAKAAKVLEAEGQDAYYPLGKSICSDLRVLVERIVEKELLADVVQRHRREVHTKGKLMDLAKIRVEDCKLVEEIMTKYSRFEHSQSEEAPVAIPTPDEIEADIDRILEWHKKFTGRKNPS